MRIRFFPKNWHVAFKILLSIFVYFPLSIVLFIFANLHIEDFVHNNYKRNMLEQIPKYLESQNYDFSILSIDGSIDGISGPYPSCSIDGAVSVVFRGNSLDKNYNVKQEITDGLYSQRFATPTERADRRPARIGVSSYGRYLTVYFIDEDFIPYALGLGC